MPDSLHGQCEQTMLDALMEKTREIERVMDADETASLQWKAGAVSALMRMRLAIAEVRDA